METEWFVLASIAVGGAFLLAFFLWYTSGSEVEEANEIGEAGEYLIALEAARNRAGFRATTLAGINRAIDIILGTINRTPLQRSRLRRFGGGSDINVRAPAGTNIIINQPSGQEQGPNP